MVKRAQGRGGEAKMSGKKEESRDGLVQEAGSVQERKEFTKRAVCFHIVNRVIQAGPYVSKVFTILVQYVVRPYTLFLACKSVADTEKKETECLCGDRQQSAPAASSELTG